MFRRICNDLFLAAQNAAASLYAAAFNAPSDAIGPLSRCEIEYVLTPIGTTPVDAAQAVSVSVTRKAAVLIWTFVVFLACGMD